MPRERNRPEPFTLLFHDEDIRKERHKARELRNSQWWKRKLAKGRCHYCGKAFSAGQLTMDHIVPLSRGGKSSRANVVTACKTCNTMKKHLLPMEWEVYLEHLKEGD